MLRLAHFLAASGWSQPACYEFRAWTSVAIGITNTAMAAGQLRCSGHQRALNMIIYCDQVMELFRHLGLKLSHRGSIPICTRLLCSHLGLLRRLSVGCRSAVLAKVQTAS